MRIIDKVPIFPSGIEPLFIDDSTSPYEAVCRLRKVVNELVSKVNDAMTKENYDSLMARIDSAIGMYQSINISAEYVTPGGVPEVITTVLDNVLSVLFKIPRPPLVDEIVAGEIVVGNTQGYYESDMLTTQLQEIGSTLNTFRANFASILQQLENLDAGTIPTADEIQSDDPGNYYNTNTVRDQLQEIGALIASIQQAVSSIEIGSPNASEIPADDGGNFYVTSTVYGQLQEIGIMIGTINQSIVSLQNAISNISIGAVAAGNVSTTDAGGYYDTATVEGNLQEIGSRVSGTLSTISTINASLTNISNSLSNKANVTDITAANELARLKSVDGVGSGLDADKFKGQDIIPVIMGGTGGVTKNAAKNNLGISWGTADPTGGSDGDIYFKIMS